MSVHSTIAKEIRVGWYVKCPVCGTRIDLDRSPVPGGMECNIETCFECGADIEVNPPPEGKRS